MKKEDVDLEEMFENETGKEWHRTYPHIYTKWLEDKLTEQLVKNHSTPIEVGQSEQFYCVSSNALVYGKPCNKWCGYEHCKELCK